MVLYLSIALIVILTILFIKSKHIQIGALAVFIVFTVWYSAVIYKAPDTFRGTPAPIEHLLDLPQGTWVLSFYSDFRTYIAIWVIKPKDTMPTCYYMDWDESFMSKLNKAKAESNMSGGYLRITKGIPSKDGRGGTKDSDGRNDIEVVDPREVLKKDAV